jgi:hydrogenase expression/formation protein HypD
VVSGFEAWDMLKSISMLLAEVVEGRAEVEIEYSRSVTETGNVAARTLMAEVFEECDTDWRGIGTIPRSGLAIRSKYVAHDAARVFGVQFVEVQVNPACRCGDVLRGTVSPLECKLFGRTCTPVQPFGPCMVSGEGTCAAYYKYERRAA